MNDDSPKCDVLLIGYECEENLGLRYIAAFLAKNGLKVGIVPYESTSRFDIVKRIKTQSPKIVGFSLIFQGMLLDFANLVTYLRSEGVTAHFTIGGHFPTAAFEETLMAIPGMDSVILCEGEETLLELYQRLDDLGEWQKVRGLAYRNDDHIETTPPRPLITDLDSLPFPIRIGKIRDHMGIGLASILAGRGCEYDCCFCSIREFYAKMPGPRRRIRSPSNVVKEMKQLFDSGVRIFIFRDDDLGMKSRSDKRWIDEFLKCLDVTMLSGQIMFRFPCRVDEMDRVVAEKLKEAGLAFLYMGIESGSIQGLNAFNKHYGVDDLYQALRIIDMVGIEFEYGFMLLHPDASFESMRNDLSFLRYLGENGRAMVHFTKMVPYAGTPIALRLKEEGRLAGTIASPDYSYEDLRIALLEKFLSYSFNDMFFSDGGLGYKLQSLQFNSMVLRKFFPEFCDIEAYCHSVRDLINRCNEATVSTANAAMDFMSVRSYEEICKCWKTLKILADRELSYQAVVTSEADYLNSVGMWHLF